MMRVFIVYLRMYVVLDLELFSTILSDFKFYGGLTNFSKILNLFLSWERKGHSESSEKFKTEFEKVL